MRTCAVTKFGGTSVATAAGWQQVATRARELVAEGRRAVVVASALAGVTNALEAAVAEAVRGGGEGAVDALRARHLALATELGLADEAVGPVAALFDELGRLLDGVRLLGEASPRLRARVLSAGELASTWIGVAALRALGLAAVRVDARRLLTTEARPGSPEATRYLEARVALPAPEVARPAFDALAGDADVVVTQGFIAATPEGHTALLGRGGSDTSAALIAAQLGADVLEIWTDVHGLFTSDPRQVPSARLIRRLRYREAEELAALGAKVLHPRCLGPARAAGVPVVVRHTHDPDGPTTTVAETADDAPTVLAVVARGGVTVLHLHTLAMWGAAGFLARVFAPFAAHGVSVDQVATSQSAVTLTLDHVPGGLEGEPLAAVLSELSELGEVTLRPDCAVVSVVGRHLRTILHELGAGLTAFEEQAVHLVGASAEDLALSFVVDAADAPRLVRKLHGALLGEGRRADWLGPTWAALTAPEAPVPPRTAWWRGAQETLLGLVADGAPRWAYHLPTVRARARGLRAALPEAGLFYAMKANAHPAVLRAVVAEGFGLECVSAGEVAAARAASPDARLLFTPNFCPVDEYRVAFEAGADVVIDGPDVLRQAPSLFAGRAVGLRLDPGTGHGHHDKVKTAGAHTKFGHPPEALDEVLEACEAVGVTIVGLHAHVGSGILSPGTWAATARTLLALRPRLPALRWVDVGGGLGVPTLAGDAPLDLAALADALGGLGDAVAGLELRLEPGRYLVAEAGVLLLPVTQVRQKGGLRLVGAAAGMNALLRPALYGAWHPIWNLSRLGAPAVGPADVVGPICETGDVLGRDRLLPETAPGDVLVVELGGAYGAVMASRYNLRALPEEVVLDP